MFYGGREYERGVAMVEQAVGLNPDFVQEYFAGTTGHLRGVGLEEVENELLEQHELAFGNKIVGNLPLDAGGELYWRRDGELHQWNPSTVAKLQYAVRTGNYEAYREFASYLNDQDQQLQTIRGLLDFDIDEHASIPSPNRARALTRICREVTARAF